MEKRKLQSLPLAPGLKTKLSKAGYSCIGDLASTTCGSLSKECLISEEDASAVLQVIANVQKSAVRSCTGLDLLQREDNSAVIMTFSEQLDLALDGGIRCGQITEICGLPGTGKTQMCVQLCCGVQIPGVFGGLDGQALYVETGSGFVVDRVVNIVTATVQHCHNMANTEANNEMLKCVSGLTKNTMLAGIHVRYCSSSDHLLSTVNCLPDFLIHHPKVRLVVIDSISSFFRHEFEDMLLRTRVLTSLAQTLVRYARLYNIAVVLTNQMTTKVYQGSEKTSKLVPCLGESWGHACTNRIILEQSQGNRHAWLYKVTGVKQAKVPFQVTSEGIRDIVSDLLPGNSGDNQEILSQPCKRPRLDL